MLNLSAKAKVPSLQVLSPYCQKSNAVSGLEPKKLLDCCISIFVTVQFHCIFKQLLPKSPQFFNYIKNNLNGFSLSESQTQETIFNALISRNSVFEMYFITQFLTRFLFKHLAEGIFHNRRSLITKVIQINDLRFLQNMLIES